MPIVRLEIIEDAEPKPLPDGALQRVADDLGDVFESGEGGTWVRARTVARQDYAENGAQLNDSMRPVLVYIIKYRLPPLADRREEAAEVARCVAAALERPVENTHVIFEPAGQGRVAFGGVLRE